MIHKMKNAFRLIIHNNFIGINFKDYMGKINLSDYTKNHNYTNLQNQLVSFL